MNEYAPRFGDAPAILVVSRDADEYVALLGAEGIVADPAADGDQARRRYAGQAVVLGEPAPVAAALQGMDGVRWVQSTWAGVTPLLPAARAGIAVTGVRDVFGPQMAEYVLGYALAHELGVVRRRDWQAERRWVAAPTGRLEGKRLGVLGTGSIGRVVAERAAAMGMRALGCSLSGTSHPAFERVWPSSKLTGFLGECHYVVGILPDTPATAGMLNAEAFAAMRDDAVLINVGRGSLVDEQALLDGLRAGRPAAAVLDVFADEPLARNHPFWAQPNLSVTAHVAAWSRPADITRVFLDNLRRFVDQTPLRHRIDPDRGY